MKNYSWIAYYSDGNSLSQYNEDGSENRFGDIDESRLINFVLSREHTNSLKPEDFAVSISAGVIVLKNDTKITFGHNDTNRLIYFRRNKLDFAFGGSLGNRPAIVHVIGVQATVNDKNKKFLLGVEDATGSVVVIDG